MKERDNQLEEVAKIRKRLYKNTHELKSRLRLDYVKNLSDHKKWIDDIMKMINKDARKILDGYVEESPDGEMKTIVLYDE